MIRRANAVNCRADLSTKTEERQGRVLSLVLAGQSDHQIAETLGVPLAIVSEHLAKLELIASTGRSYDLVARLAEARRATVQASAQAAESASAPQPATRRVLLADDHHINHLTIQAMLDDRQIEVVAAFNGAEAVEKFKAGGFDRVLMDIDMPLMDGMSAVRAIRTFESERGATRTPIAMFTALSGRDIEDEARQAGADSYLTKPITLNQLYAFVDARPQRR